MAPWKRRFLLETIIFRFHVKIGEGTIETIQDLFHQEHGPNWYCTYFAGESSTKISLLLSNLCEVWPDVTANSASVGEPTVWNGHIWWIWNTLTLGKLVNYLFVIFQWNMYKYVWMFLSKLPRVKSGNSCRSWVHVCFDQLGPSSSCKKTHPTLSFSRTLWWLWRWEVSESRPRSRREIVVTHQQPGVWTPQGRDGERERCFFLG